MCFQNDLYSLTDEFIRQNETEMMQCLNIRHSELFIIINNKKVLIS